MGQFSLDPQGLEAAYALQSVSEVAETQLGTEEIMRVLSSSYVDSGVTCRKVIGSSEILPTKPGVVQIHLRLPDRWLGTGRAQLLPGRPQIGEILVPRQ